MVKKMLLTAAFAGAVMFVAAGCHCCDPGPCPGPCPGPQGQKSCSAAAPAKACSMKAAAPAKACPAKTAAPAKACPAKPVAPQQP